MKLWAVTMVRDEADILPYTLAHLASEGIDGIIVADNRSTDGTLERLTEMSLRPAAYELEVLIDETVGYYQSTKMTALARRAFSYGADWVIPFDADELWCDPSGTTRLHDTFSELPDTADIAEAVLYNYFPTSQDPEGEANPFRRITARDRQAAGLPKVALHRADLTIAQGNHDATRPSNVERARANLRVAHFPSRSPEQFVRKARNGYEAYKATDLPEHIGAHWRQYGQLLEDHGEQALNDVFYEWFHDPPGDVVTDPAPWCHAANEVGKD